MFITGMSASVYKDQIFYIDFIRFLVEDHLFQIPKYVFSDGTDSNYFWESLEPAVFYQGAFKLEGVKKDDFRALLKRLYLLGTNSDNKQNLTTSEWKSVLKLSFTWKMHHVFEDAIKVIRQKLPLSDQVALARSYGTSSWLKELYSELVLRESFFSEQEAKTLGLDTVTRLIGIRERHKGCTPSQRRNPHAEPSFAGSIPDELKELSEAEIAPSIGDQVMLARKYAVHTWLEDVYKRLLHRSEPISPQEANMLGLETTISICRTRDTMLEGNPSLTYSEFPKEVLRIFHEEFKGLEEIHVCRSRPPLPPKDSPLGERLLDDPSSSSLEMAETGK